MTTPTTERTGSRQRLPHSGDRACASCGEPRGKRRSDWNRVTTIGADGIETVVGWTCPNCPTWNEPIRRIVSASGTVRYYAAVDSTPSGETKRRQASKRCATLAEAREFVAAVRTGVARSGSYAPTTVAGLCEVWLASKNDIREVTRQGYQSALRPALQHIGHRPVTKVTVAEINAMVSWMRKDGGSRGQALSPRSVKMALGALSQAFDVAVEAGTLPRNEVRLAKRPRQRSRKGADLEHWLPSELLQFRDTADGDALAGAWRLTLSGLTRADVMGLRWSDVNWPKGTVTVRQGRVALAKGDLTDDPKSDHRRREVPVEQMHSGTVALLQSMRAAQAENRLVAGPAWHDSGLVVVDALGRGLRPEFYSDSFRRLCTAAGVPSIRLHSVRHSLAFWLHALGVTPAAAAALLGHTVEVHLSTYLPEAGADGIAAAAAALAGATRGGGHDESVVPGRHRSTA